MVLLPAQGIDAAAIAGVAFTSEDRARDVIRNVSTDRFASLYPKYKGGRPPKFTHARRREIKKTAKSHPAGHGLPFPHPPRRIHDDPTPQLHHQTIRAPD